MARDKRAADDAPPGPRPIGLAAGAFIVPDNLDDPLPDDILDAFEGDEHAEEIP